MRIFLLRIFCAAGLLLFITGRVSAQHFSFTCARDTIVPACLPSGCFTLKHILPDLKGLTDSYTINPSNYAQTTCVPVYVQPNDPAGTPTNLTVDDTYSGVITPGFPFPFYGTIYNTLVASTNGYISFDATLAGTGSHWAAGADLPSGTYDRALIMGPYHDLDPSVTTSPTRRIQYQVWGTAPHRRWVLSFYRVPLFGGACNPIIENTHQIILYESTGIFEVTIFSKQACAAWNSGRALVGIQNFARTLGMTVAGRAAIANPPWSVSAPGESWRFVPNGGASLFKRVELLNSGGTLIATGTAAPIPTGKLEASFPNVCPPAGTTTTYIVRSVYQKIDDPATEIFGYDTVRVNRNSGLSANASFSSGSCGAATGTITVNNVLGGNGSYEYSIISGPTTRPWQASNVFTGLTSGTYTVSVRDGSSPVCTIDLNVTVPQTGFLTATITAEPTTCTTFSNGSITVNSSNGGGGYNITVSNGGGTFTNVSVPFTINNLAVGSYQVNVTHPATNCNLQAPVTVNVAQGPGVTGSVLNYTPASCFFAQNGSATIRPTSGTGPFNMTLSPTGTTVTGVTNNHTFTNLPGGPGYSVVIQDASGCNSSPIALTVPSANNSSTAVATVSCGAATGTITVTATGGNPPFRYSINGGVTWQTSNVFTNLAPGNYNNIRVEHGDAVCLSITSATVPAGSALTANVVASGIPCGSSGNTGTITITPTAGTGPYEYSLDGTNWQSSATFTGLAVGSYTAYFRELNGCPGSQPVTISSIPLSATTSSTATTCNGASNGTITVTVPGGGSNIYSFSVDGGPPQNSTSPVTFSGLSAGGHTIVVSNASPPACTSTPVTVFVTAGSAFNAVASTTATSCPGANNGTITITPDPGGSPYLYSLDGTNNVTTGGNSYTYTGISAGTHTIVVTNSFGCVTGTITVNVPAGPPMTANATPTGTTCALPNGSITVSAPTGGTAPYQYSIDGTNWQSSPTFSNLPGGTYIVRIRDNAAVCSLTIPNVVVASSTAITAAGTQVTNASCGGNNGIIMVNTPTGGTAPYQYSIDGGTTWQPGATFSGLAPGSYNISIRDAGAAICTTTISNVTVGQAAPLAGNGAAAAIATCGTNNGSITVNAPTGGTPPYQYSIDGGTTWQGGTTFTGLAPGTYTITIRDATTIPCITTITNISVGQTTGVTAAGASTTLATCGSNNGSITVNVPAGGTAPYQYSINGGTTWQPGTTFTGLASGNYTVTIRDAGATSCTATITNVFVGQTSSVTAAGATPALATCGANNGSITVNIPTGGTPPYQYSINGGTTWQAGTTFSGLAPGNYTVTIRDAGATACTTTITGINVGQTTAITAAGASTTLATCGLNNGSIGVNAPGGGTPPYQYSINGGTSWQASPSFFGLAPGTYTVTIRDMGATPCTGTINNIVVSGTSAIAAAGTSTTQATCGNPNGSITVNAPSGGTPPYQYSINGGTSWQASPVFNGLTAGSYTITIRDAGATVCTATINGVTVVQTSAVTASPQTTGATCGNANGVINVTGATGGTAPYQYSLDGVTWQAGTSFPGLTGGNYTVWVRDNAATCSSTIPVTVSATTAITATTTATIATCGNNNGTITVNAPTGGTPPYQYSIDGGTNWQAGTTFTGLAPGNYTVTVRDAGATVCTTSINNITVGQTTAVVAAGATTSLATCGNANGSITVNPPTGGTAPYQYSIDGGTTWQAGTTFNGLAGGNYTVTIRDAGTSACTTTINNINVGQTTAVAAAGATPAQATCGNANGSITVNAPSGGTPPYQYSIDGGSTWQAANVFTGLAPGSYTVTIRDAGATACTATINNITVTQTTALAAAGATTATATCGNNNGTITVNPPTGGTAPYQYSIDGGATWQGGTTFNGLSPGNYTITIRDAGTTPCTATINNITVNQTSAVVAAGTVTTQATCGNPNGSITVNAASGGTAPYQYSIDGGTTWQAGTTFSGLAAGNYTITIRDAGATVCTATIINVVVAQTSAVSATPQATGATCGNANGVINVTGATGGTPPYQYSLDGVTWQASNTFTGLTGSNYTVWIRDLGATCSTTIPVSVSQTAAVTATTATTPTACGVTTGSITVNGTAGGTGPYQYSLDGITWQASNIFNNLGVGNYTVRVRDNGAICSTTLPVTITQTGSIAATTTTAAASCTGVNNGSVTITTAGGSGPYTFSLDGAAPQAGTLPYTFTNVSAGPHTVVVADQGSGCSTNVLNVTVAAGAGVNATAAQTATTCPTAANGTVTITPTTGAAPYTYSLDGGAAQSNAGAYTFNAVSAGAHSVLVTDNNGCTLTVPVTVAAGPSLAAAGSTTATACTGVNNGTITITPAGGTGPFQYVLDGGAPVTGASPYTFSNVAAGPHTVMVTDAAGCISNLVNVNVTVGAGVSGNATAGATTCPTANNGSITVTAVAGTGPYTYALDGGAFQSGANPYTFNNVAAGPHTVVIRDAAGCTHIVNVPVTAGPPLATTVNKTDALCNGSATGTITVTPPATGTPPFQYSLDGITWQAAATFPGLVAGNYTVSYREAGGCQGSQPVTITEPAALASNGTLTAVRCNGQNNGTITMITTGGIAPYQYSIDGGTTWQASTIFNVAAGNHTITVRDANNCSITRNFTVTEPAALSATTVITQASCNGGNDGVITVSAMGGNPTYQYSIDGVNFQASNTFNVAPGVFTVTVRDNQGCISTANATVTVGSNFSLVPQPDITICEGRSAQLQLNTNATQFSWTPAAGLSSTTIANPVASPATTTQYIVTATFGRCSGTDTIIVRVNPAPIPNAGPDGLVCYGQPYQLQGSGGVQYQWTPATYLSSATVANPLASPPRQTTYTLSILSDANGCASLVTDQVTLDVNPPIVVRTFPYDTIAYTGDQFSLLGVASDPTATNYTWTPATGLSSTTIPNPVVTVSAATGTILRYQVTATNAAGCRGDGFVTIRVYKGPEVYVPTGFTPNGDGRNDRLIPVTVGIERINYFRVVNRWGQLVYSTSKLNEGWDGRLNGNEQASGVFVWMLEGVTKDGRVIQKQGTTALIR